MRSFHCLVVIATVVATATAEYDWTVCRKRWELLTPSTSVGVMPLFYDNFYVFMELKNLLNETVTYIDEDYSEQTEMAYFRVRNDSMTDNIWVDARSNEFMLGPTATNKCQDATLSGSIFSEMLGVTVDSAHDVQLNTPEVALGWHRKYIKNSTYLGPTVIRGIKTDKWAICSYNDVTDTTTFTEWYINLNTSSLPLVTADLHKPIFLPVMAHAVGISKLYPNNIQDIDMRIDFTFFDRINPNGSVFKISPDMICAARKTQNISLPVAPTYFQFKGEQIVIMFPNSQPPNPPSLVYTVEKYMHGQKIFVQDIISPPRSGSFNDKSFSRTIDDFNTGLSFSMDLKSGSCRGNPISHESVDTVSIAGGYVQLRNYQQFFDIDSDQYQYMGINTIRGIDCDTWSAYFNDKNPLHAPNALYTWYFANPQWMKKYNYRNWANPLPVTLVVQQVDQFTQFNIYNYDTADNIDIPDVSLCMDPQYTLNVEFFISAPYDNVTAYTMDAVNRGLYAALISKTNLKTVLRISKFDLQPSGTETSVKFKLFDLRSLHVIGDIQNSNYGATNQQIFDKLSMLINSNAFSIDVLEPNNTGMIYTFYPRSNSLGLFKDGKFVKMDSYVSSSSNYSSGSMAGIGIGMLILGLILGIVAIFAVRKVRRMKSETQLDTAKLDNETEA